MKSKIKIAGVDYKIRDLAVGESQLLDGAGKIKKSTIKRISETKYKILVVFEYSVIDKTLYTFGSMLGFLQATYDMHGGLV